MGEVMVNNFLHDRQTLYEPNTKLDSDRELRGLNSEDSEPFI